MKVVITFFSLFNSLFSVGSYQGPNASLVWMSPQAMEWTLNGFILLVEGAGQTTLLGRGVLDLCQLELVSRYLQLDVEKVIVLLSFYKVILSTLSYLYG